jgi:flagellar motor switch protein FliM
MNPGAVHSLTRDNLRRLLAGVGGAKPDPAVEPAFRPHDWRQCRSFNDEQMRKLEAYAGQVSTAVSGVFTRLCRRPFEVKVVATGQQYASQVTESLAAGVARDAFLPFGPTSNPPMATLMMPEKTARHWAQLLLGTVESADESQGLSSLEQSLLVDVARAVVEALRIEGSGLNVQPGTDLVVGRLPVTWDPMEELLKISFSVQQADAQDLSKAAFVLPCRLLAGLAGKAVEATAQTTGPDASKRILQCIQDIPVPVTVQLGTVILTVEDVMGLAADDVVVLDQSPQEPIDVTIRGRSAFRGLPVQHQGRMAVLITEAVSLSG